MHRFPVWLAAAAVLAACDAPQGPTLSGTVTMPEDLQAKLGESDTLFIIARPAGQTEGPPLAVKRFVGARFPLSYTFDQKDVIQPTQTLAGEVVVKASIHKSGLANIRVAGDMEGEFGKPVKVGAQDVDFAIDRVLE